MKPSMPATERVKAKPIGPILPATEHARPYGRVKEESRLHLWCPAGSYVYTRVVDKSKHGDIYMRMAVDECEGYACCSSLLYIIEFQSQ